MITQFIFINCGQNVKMTHYTPNDCTCVEQFTAQEIHLIAYIYRDWFFIVKNGNGSGDFFFRSDTR